MKFHLILVKMPIIKSKRKYECWHPHGDEGTLNTAGGTGNGSSYHGTWQGSAITGSSVEDS